MLTNLTKFKDIVDKNSVSAYYNKFLKKKKPKTNFISIIIPVRGRLNFLKPVVEHLIASATLSNKKINITIVEHSNIQLFKDETKKLGVGYFWINCDKNSPFNKSLCHNIGAILNKYSEYLLFHDIDCLVFKDFFNKIIKILSNNNTHALQTFKDRRLLYLPENITKNIVDKKLNIHDIDLTDNSIIIGNEGAPGGSILIKTKLFKDIGGFDPELFYGYAPEDRFFWVKMEQYVTVFSLTNEILHMSHELMDGTNDSLEEMIKLNNSFNKLPEEDKINFINYKKNILNKYML